MDRGKMGWADKQESEAAAWRESGPREEVEERQGGDEEAQERRGVEGGDVAVDRGSVSPGESAAAASHVHDVRGGGGWRRRDAGKRKVTLLRLQPHAAEDGE